MNARKKSSRIPLDRGLPRPSPSPIEELERRVAALEKDVALLKSASPWPIFGDEEIIDTEKKKSGAKQKISDEDLFCYRDGLIQWLEPIWPWMVNRLLAAGNPEDIRPLLEAVAETPELRPDWQRRLLQNVAAFFEFLWDERFRKTLPKATVADALNLSWEDERRKRAANQLPTRQIANAMAGVPEIAWRTSLDRCSEQPAEPLIALNLDMYYRDEFDIPALHNRNLTGSSCPVPKSLQPVLTPDSGVQQTDKGPNFTTESGAGGSEDT
jgi:hypothetical protein